MDIVQQLRYHDDERLYQEADVLMSEAALEIERLRAEVDALRKVLAAAENLVRVKGRHHSEMAYDRLVSAVAAMKGEG